jgi:radical SAM superfamily enzyme YgiQ (UPF0313 family)
VYGGYFPTRVYELLLKSCPFITAIVRGDGEAAALHISRLVADGQPFPSKHIPNLAWSRSSAKAASFRLEPAFA